MRLQKFPTVLTLAAVLLAICAQSVPARDTIPDRLFRGKNAPYRLPEPAAPLPGPDSFVPPPGENPYFPIRADGQPFVLNVDTAVNITDPNHFYFDPRWRGENWTPFDSYTLLERLIRRMATWQDYDEQTEGRVGNHIAKFLEKWTGYGP